MKPVKTWILIANNEHARIVENDGPNKGLYQAPAKTRAANVTEPFVDQPGRSFRAFQSHRSKIEPHQNSSATGHEFASELVEELVQANRAGNFDRLILCSPPSMLGILRKMLPMEIRSVVTAELPKDLTQISMNDLPKHFENVLAI